ncbi:MAG TPA: lamin tail domain-containing protein [Bacilli bacterium]|nr:lamin tail domain-containing protein [Bacilli bacterium]
MVAGFSKRAVFGLVFSLIVGGIIYSVNSRHPNEFGLSASSSSVIIKEVYGGGGNSGATYKNDFIELYNLSSGTVSLADWSVQYASATGNSWAVTALSGSIVAGGYYLVQEAQGAGGTVDLPTPDAIGTIAMSATAGKVALVNSVTPLTGTNPSSVAGVIDFVGFGSTANGFEGSGPTPAPSNTTSVQRKVPITDNDDNANDFAAGAPSPKNSSYNGVTDAASYATTFLASSASGEFCTATEGWSTLETSYNALSSGAKTEFRINDDNATIINARARYLYLIGYNESLTDYVGIGS